MTYIMIGEHLEAVGALFTVVLVAEVVHELAPALEGLVAALLVGAGEEAPLVALHLVDARVLGRVHGLLLLLVRVAELFHVVVVPAGRAINQDSY